MTKTQRQLISVLEDQMLDARRQYGFLSCAKWDDGDKERYKFLGLLIQRNELWIDNIYLRE